MPVIKLPAKTVATSAAAHHEPTIVLGPPTYFVEPTIKLGPPVYAVEPTVMVGPPVYAVEPTIMVGPPVYATQAVAGASSTPALGFVMDPNLFAPGPVYVDPGYSFVIWPPAPAPMVPGYIGDKVFLDANGNGLQDAGEAGIAGQTVELYRKGEDRVFGTADDILVSSQLTGADGSYRFTHMFGENNLFLDSTIYQVAVKPTAGYGFTTQDAGNNDSLDSDFGANGRSQTISMTWGENNTSVDAGLVKLDQHNASIGDKVWNDANRNGIQDAGEAGMANQHVDLTGAGVDKVFGTTDDVMETVTTDANGHYAFTGLAAGDYKVGFAAFSVGSWGWDTSPAHAGSDAAVDSNTTYGEVIHLAAGENNTSVDGGLYYWTNPQFEIPHVDGNTPDMIPDQGILTVIPFEIVGPYTPTPVPYIMLAEPTFTLDPAVIVGPGTQMQYPVAPEPVNTFTLNPEILAKSATLLAGMPLLHASDELLHSVFGQADAASTYSGGEMFSHAGDMVRQLLTAMDAYASSTVAMA